MQPCLELFAAAKNPEPRTRVENRPRHLWLGRWRSQEHTQAELEGRREKEELGPQRLHHHAGWPPESPSLGDSGSPTLSLAEPL